MLADGDADVRRAPSLGRKEQEIAGFDFHRRHVIAGLPLLFDDAGDRDAVLGEDVLNQPAAVESRRVRAPQPVRNAAEPERGQRHGSAIETPYCKQMIG